MNDQKPLKVVKAAATRWLTHKSACDRVISRFTTLLDTLDTIYDTRGREPDVAGLHMCMLNPTTILTLLLLANILHLTNILTLYLQTSCLSLNSVCATVQTIIGNLGTLLEDPLKNGNNLKTYEQFLDLVEERNDLARVRRSRTAATNTSSGSSDRSSFIEKFLSTTAKPMIRDTISELESAFEMSPVLASFDIFNNHLLPRDPSDMFTYGNDKLDQLIQHYGSHISDRYKGHINTGQPLIKAEET